MDQWRIGRPRRGVSRTLGVVWGDDEDAQIRAIEVGVLDVDVPSRRHRRRILAVDRDGDVAAVLVAVRGKRRERSETAHLYRRGAGGWEWCGSAGSSDSEPRIPDRSTIERTAIEFGGQGSSGGRAFSHPVRAATLRAGEGIAALEWRGVVRPVSPSGFAVVVWRGRRPPTVIGLDVGGTAVTKAAVGLNRSPMGRLPLAARIARRVAPRPGPDDWFNYAPRH